jgi:HAD superfamily hydrolase (TIGR01509 family)
VGRRKPQPAAYLEAAVALEVRPFEVVFIDDKARNTRAAEEQGMTGVVFTGAAELSAALAQLGLLVAA